MTPQSEQVAFFHAMGKAIAQWSYVEKMLLSVVSACAPTSDEETIALGFLSIENFRSKLQFSDNLMALKFGKTTHAADWFELHKKLTALSQRRNMIAHNVITAYPAGAQGRRFALESWLVKSGGGTKKKRPLGASSRPPTDAICLRDIERCRLEFLALANGLSNFAHRLRGKPEPIAKFHEQPSDPLTIRNIEGQILGALGHPPQPSRRKQKEKS